MYLRHLCAFTDGSFSALGSEFALARYLPNGVPDKSFNYEGKQTTSFGPNSISIASAVAIQDDGKIVVAGVTASSLASTQDGDNYIALARYLPEDGALDPSFGQDPAPWT